MTNEPEIHPIHRSMSKPLTILGVERKLFFCSALVGAGVFNFFGSLLGGLLMFAVLFFAARVATAKDPQLLRILLNAAKFKSRYDPAKRLPWPSKRIGQND
jgi:type IV secretory pathway TrbD component